MKYRYGFNGQVRDAEVYGIGNLNTAMFWEYDTRLGRRWNVDPVDQISISNYACFAGNKISFVDLKGDIVEGDEEAGKSLENSIKHNLGEKNPFSYNKDSKQLQYDENFDLSKYSPRQMELVNRYIQLIESDVVNSVTMVDYDEKIEDLGGLSFAEIGANGYTRRFTETTFDENNKVESKKLIENKVFVARDPTKIHSPAGSYDLNGRYFPPDPNSYRTENYEFDFVGVVMHHELTGHAWLNIYHPYLDKKKHNEQVELWESIILKFYNVGKDDRPNYYYRNSDVQKHDD